MAETKTTSPLLGKLGGKLVQAHNETKDKPVELGNVQLPAGIENGVAEVRTLKMSTYEKGDYKGQPFFMASAVVLSPLMHKGVKVEGLQTRIGPMPLCDTKGKDFKTGNPRTVPFSEHYDKFTNVLKALGFDISKVVPPATMSDAQKAEFIEKALVAGMQQLVAKKVKTRFRTWQGKSLVIKQKDGKFVVENEDGSGFKGLFMNEDAAKKAFPYAGKDSLITHEWNGAVDFVPATSDTGTNDQSGDAPEPDAPVLDDAPPTTTTEEPAFDEFAEDLPTLLARTGDDDDNISGAAGKKILEIAGRYGIADEVEAKDSWEEGVALLQAKIQEGTGSADEPSPDEPADEPFVPEVGTVYNYQPHDSNGKPLKDKATKKPVKPIQVVVKSTNTKTRTFTAVDNETKKKKFDGIPFDHLV